MSGGDQGPDVTTVVAQQDKPDTPDEQEPRSAVETLAEGRGRSRPDVRPPPPDIQLPGQLRRYQLGDMLGRGGMGEVVSARDAQIGRAVAVKRLRSAEPSVDLVERFVREARIQGRLERPAIVPVHELGVDDRGNPYFTMKQLAGTTLGDVLKKLAAGDAGAAARFTRGRLLRAFTDVCLAIEFAHTRGVVHRDLKPANIMLGEFGEVYVLDWGIARILDDAKRTGAEHDTAFADVSSSASGTLVGQVLGTPGYMSPEQLYGAADLDGRSDVYALGCILFELLAGESLHPRDTAIPSTLAGVDAQPSHRVPDRDVAPELDAICQRAVALDRAQRHQTARALGEDVQHFLDGDRDLALRKQLAVGELAQARTAVARGSRADDRRIAIRAAGRALALDPSGGAAELVAHLMLEPPSEVPAEVEAQIKHIDEDALYAGRRLTIAVMISYLSFWPILYLAGLRPPWFTIGGAVVCVSTAIAAWLVPRRRVDLFAYTSMAGNLSMIFLFSRLVGPFTAAPGLAVIFAMTMGSHVRVIRAPLLAALICTAALLPWLLGVLGVTAATVSISGDALVFHTVAAALEGGVAMAGLVIYVLLLIAMAIGLTRIATGHRRKAQREVQLQAWQLRQLVAGP